MDAAGFGDALISVGVGRGHPVALVVKPGLGIGVAVGGGAWASAGVDDGSGSPFLSGIAAMEAALRPRWVLTRR